MTETEAKTKWCPMVRDPEISNRMSLTRMPEGIKYKTPNCIGSACMMWRELGEDQSYPTRKNGYCGLASIEKVLNT